MARHSKEAAPSGTCTRLPPVPGVLGEGVNAYNHATGAPREDTCLERLRQRYLTLLSQPVELLLGHSLSLVPLHAEQEAPHEGGIHKSQTSFLSLLVIG